jgi:hypothetical protein
MREKSFSGVNPVAKVMLVKYFLYAVERDIGIVNDLAGADSPLSAARRALCPFVKE